MIARTHRLLVALVALGLPPLVTAARAQSLEDLVSLFAQAGGQQTVFSTFTEKRWFGFRKEPVVLEGELRLDPTRGLSLRYLRPEERTVIIDPKGILMREAKQRDRALPSDPRTGGIERSLLAVMRFDMNDVAKAFTIGVGHTDTGWRLTLQPKDPELGRTLGAMTIDGVADQVNHLEFRRSASQRIEILVHDTRRGVVFAPDDLRRYFR